MNVQPLRDKSRRLACVLFAPALLLFACGPTHDRSGSTTPSADSPSASNSPSPSTKGWQVYTNSEFSFRVSYPASFIVENPEHGDPVPGWPLELRAVDGQYATGYPPGQVEFGVYARDADTLTGWIQKHTGPCGSPNANAFYFDNPLNPKATTAAGHDAVAFDDNLCGEGVSHETVFLMSDSSHVFRFDWWSSDSTYTSTIQSVADQMLKSLQA